MAPRRLLALSCLPAVLGFTETDDDVSLLQHTVALKPHPSSADSIASWVPTRFNGTAKSIPAPREIVDLDVLPELRWSNVTRFFRERNLWPNCCREPVQLSLPEALVASIPEEYERELRGLVADAADPLITYENLLSLQYGYELTGRRGPKDMEAMKAFFSSSLPHANIGGGCSDILAAQPDGTVVHGRNLDYSIASLAGDSLEVLFVKDGKPFVTSMHWPGMIGFHTAMRYGGWSVAQNTRYHGLAGDLISGISGSKGFMLGLREIMETTPDFESAVDRVRGADWMAPQYFIMAGAKPNEGAVVAVDRDAEHLRGTPRVQRLGGANGWHLVQTNDDLGETPLDYRRGEEELRMKQINQSSIDAVLIEHEMTGPALLNADTLFTSVFVPRTGYAAHTVHFLHNDTQ